MKKNGRPRKYPERFWDNTIPGENGCIVWTAANSTGRGTQPYGQWWDGKRLRPAHRVSYEEKFGLIPEGFEIDHLCKNTLCVNPDHLEVVSPRVNVLRGDTIARKHMLTTHCPKGHEYNEENTKIATYANGRKQRQCRICMREQKKLYNRRKKKIAQFCI